MMLSILITMVVVPAVLAHLVNVLATEGYTGRVPGGADAMGLVLPLFVSIGGTLALIVASWLCVARGGMAWVGVSTALAAVLATVVSLGVGLAAIGTLLAWMEKMGTWVPMAGVLLGGVAPLCLGGLLLACAWMQPAALATSSMMKVVGGVIVASALCGYGMGFYGAIKQAKRSDENVQRAREQEASRSAEWERKSALPRLDALKEDYAQMSADSPLWVFVAALPDESAADVRAFIVARALAVPDLDAQLAKTITGEHPRYRHGCADLIRFAPAESVKPEWAKPLEAAIRTTAEQIANKPTWLTPDDFSNPHPSEHVRAMVEAATRLGGGPALDGALKELKRAVKGATAGTEQPQALEALANLAD